MSNALAVGLYAWSMHVRWDWLRKEVDKQHLSPWQLDSHVGLSYQASSQSVPLAKPIDATARNSLLERSYRQREQQRHAGKRGGHIKGIHLAHPPGAAHQPV